MRHCVQLNGMLEGNPTFSFSVIKDLLMRLGWEKGECHVECTVVKREGWFRIEEKQVHLQLSDIDQRIPKEMQKVIKARFKAHFEIETTKLEEIMKEIVNFRKFGFIHDLRKKGCKEGYLDLMVSGQYGGRIRVGWGEDGSWWVDLNRR